MGTFRDDLTADYVRSRLDYNPTDGAFTWRATGNPNWDARWVGKLAGKRCKTLGYRLIRIDTKAYMAHRLAWLVTHGEWPGDQLDHRDGDRSNNRIKNLRVVSNQENAQNLPAHRKRFGLLGAHRHGDAWIARIGVQYESLYLGRFKTENEAHQAYLRAKRRLHQFQNTPRKGARAHATPAY